MTLRLGVLGADGLHSAIISGYLNSTASSGRATVELVYDADPAASAGLAERIGARSVSDPSEMAGAIDGLLVLHRYGDDHTRHWEAACALGVPVFVDKPFAEGFADARWMIELAAAKGTRLFSSSHFRFTPALRASGVFPPALGAAVSGPRLTALVDDERQRHLHPSYYGIHVIEIGQALLGPGVHSLRALRRRELDTVILQYSDGRAGMLELVNNLQLDWRAQVVDAYSFHTRSLEIPHVPAQYHALGEAIIDFVAGGDAGVPIEDTLECLAILEAIERSVASGGSDVQLAELSPLAD